MTRFNNNVYWQSRRNEKRRSISLYNIGGRIVVRGSVSVVRGGFVGFPLTWISYSLPTHGCFNKWTLCNTSGNKEIIYLLQLKKPSSKEKTEGYSLRKCCSMSLQNKKIEDSRSRKSDQDFKDFKISTVSKSSRESRKFFKSSTIFANLKNIFERYYEIHRVIVSDLES